MASPSHVCAGGCGSARSGASGEQRDAFDHITEGADWRRSSAMPAPASRRCWASRARHGSAEAIRCAAPPCPGSRPRIWRADPASGPAPSPALNMAGRRAATSSPATTCWWWTRRA
jgi:hypothetical protein